MPLPRVRSGVDFALLVLCVALDVFDTGRARARLRLGFEPFDVWIRYSYPHETLAEFLDRCGRPGLHSIPRTNPVA